MPTVTQGSFFEQPQKIELPATGVQQTLPGCGASPQASPKDSGIPLPFSGIQIDKPEPVFDFIDPSYPHYLSDIEKLAEKHDGVYVEKSKGRGKHHGKHYCQITFADTVVKHDGRLYKGAQAGPEEYDPSIVTYIHRWDWKMGRLTLYERVKDLLAEHEEAVEEHPFLATCADKLYRHLMGKYDLREHYMQSGLIKFWLNCYNLFRYHELQEPFQIRLIGWPVGKAVKTAFPDTTITKWPDIPHGFLEQLKGGV